MSKKIKFILRDSLRLLLGVKWYNKIRFFITHRYLLNTDKPVSFSEKIIYRKISTAPELYSKYVDKYAVRKYVSETIGAKYLIKLLKAVDHIEPCDFDDLPDSFVIKTSNGGGGENVLIVEDKSKLNLLEVCNTFNSFLSIKMGVIVDEHFYDIETPKIIFEELMKHNDGRYPSDYKIHIFNGGDTTKLYIQVDADRFGNHKRTIYNEDLTPAGFSIQPKYESVDFNFTFPSNIKELLYLAKILSKDFKYVRVDMYSVDDRVYFGEMTFCHGSGWEPISPRTADFMLGKLWDEFK
ncbi:ATP-grasp fold amidoligase family protein [Aeromonas caviae]|uniref:ATP-grasp fold amidoligase family protein n=1 Tax=Aeromonas caviae TaxID=648 RepID=UPI002B46561B|nr:ATP-grasp fold amidoligase family protein [Aeromonas caviae]